MDAPSRSASHLLPPRPSASSFDSRRTLVPSASSPNDGYETMDGMGLSGIIMQGYLLKKKRKKMQGMARRYFRLDVNGALSYSFGPDTPIRDSLSVPISYISAQRKQRSLHIDGGNTVYHCKALSVDDFEQWATALQKFTKRNDGTSTPLATPHGTGVATSPASGAVDLDALVRQAESMKLPLQELDTILHELRSAPPSPQFTPKLSSSPSGTGFLSARDNRVPPPQQGNGASSQHGSGSSSGGSGMFRFLGKRSNSQSAGSSSKEPNPTPSSSSLGVPSSSSQSLGVSPSPSPRSASFSSGRTPSFSSSTGPPAYLVSNSDPSTPTGGPDDKFYDASVATPDAVLCQRFAAALDQLRSTQASLVESLGLLAASQLASSQPPGTLNPSFTFGSPLSPSSTRSSSSLSSPPLVPNHHYASRSVHLAQGNFYPTHRASPSRASSRASFTSFFSADEGGDWDDAASGIEGEFVLDDESSEPTGAESDDEGDGPRGRRGPEADGARAHDDVDDVEDDDAASQETKRAGQPSRTRRRSTITEEPEEDDSLDAGEETDEEILAEEEKRQNVSPGGRSRSATQSSAYDQKVTRRTQLPAKAAPEDGIMSLAKQLIGKDLSSISLPVTTNEPISALQRIAEELEYSEILDRAAAATDPLERLTLVAVYAISTYGGNKYRVTRKPFNPLLGETYECIRPDKGFKFISEKVSHDPLVFAFHADTELDEKDRGWVIDGDLSTKTTIWGRSMEIEVRGTNCIKLTAHGEEYTIQRPSSYVRNLLLGTPYIEVVGDLIVACARTGAKAVISFKAGSTWGGESSRNKVVGKVLDSSGKAVHELVGKWDENVDRKVGKDNFERLWQIAEFPPDPKRYFGFSYFALGLNETTPLDRLHAPTDSRLRPDQLALERGDVDRAETLKKAVEQKQRDKRKNGTSARPRWFTDEGGGRWTYGGTYFDTREKEAFDDPDLF